MARPDRSVFRRGTFADGCFNLLLLYAVGTLLVTTIRLLQRVFGTVDLTGDQWRVCLIAVAAFFVLSEIGKVILRRFTHTAP